MTTPFLHGLLVACIQLVHHSATCIKLAHHNWLTTLFMACVGSPFGNMLDACYWLCLMHVIDAGSVAYIHLAQHALCSMHQVTHRCVAHASSRLCNALHSLHQASSSLCSFHASRRLNIVCSIDQRKDEQNHILLS